jgi:choice-of-anchor A domain-containing protein
MNSDVLQLTGDASDYFLFNVTGDFLFSQSEVRLTGGLTADHVIFNFPNASTIDLNKSANIFNGTILAPNLTTDLIYHNPAIFNGSIIANHISVHSDFNLNHVGFTPLCI